MELGSNRSRSNSRNSFDQDIASGNHMEQSIIRTTRSTTKTLTSSDSEGIKYRNHNQESQLSKSFQSNNGKGIRKSRYKLSDHSSEDGDEQQVSSTNTNLQNSKNEMVEEIRRSVSRSSGSNISALDFYRAAGDYWNKYPKTDYTYSPHSKDRTEIAPGVLAMPNMSRRSLHDLDYKTSSFQSSTEALDHDTVDYYSRLKSSFNYEDFSKAKPRALYTDYSKTWSTKNVTFLTKITLFFKSIFVFIYSSIASVVYGFYRVHNSTLNWLGKKLHQASTRIMLCDTWLLQKSTSRRKASSLLALCLIPLLFFAGWWLFYGIFYGDTNKFSALPIIATGENYRSSNEIDVLYKLEEEPNKIVTRTERIIVEPPKPSEIAAEFSSKQLEEIAIFLAKNSNDKILADILESSTIQNIISNYNKLHKQFESHKLKNDEETIKEDFLKSLQLINYLKEEIETLRRNFLVEKIRNDKISSMITQLKSQNIQNHLKFSHHLNRCCRNSMVSMERYVTKILKDILDAPDYISSQKDISTWLHATFVAKHDLEAHMANLTSHLKSDYSRLIESNEKLIMDKIVSKISQELNNRIEKIQINLKKDFLGSLKVDSLTDEYIKKIVHETVALYDADKTGLVDYALESAGGQILSTRCTESYQARTAVISIYGIPLWYPTNTPRTVITPGMTPGECWAFQNFPGFLIIRLMGPIKVEAFSLEHISKNLIPNGKIDSAPKDFAVYGLMSENDKNGVLLGKYKYDFDGEPLQYFAAEAHDLVFDIVELVIYSNNGNPNYTCLYRFRVHGKLITETT